MEATGDSDWYSFRGMVGVGDRTGRLEERRAGDEVVTPALIYTVKWKKAISICT